MPDASATPPVAARKPRVRTHHGDDFVDQYEWLRDKSDPEVIAYLEAENAYTDAQTTRLKDLQDAIFGEIKARTQETDLSVPVYRRHAGTHTAYWYYQRTLEGAQYSIFCRVPALPGAQTPPELDTAATDEQVLLDANAAAAEEQFFSLGAFSVSPDGTLLAYSTDTTGAERFTLHVLDLATGNQLPDTIGDIGYGATWAGRSHVFYTRNDDAWRSYAVYRHRLGTPAADDVEVYTEPDERFSVGVDSSRDDAWIVVTADSKLTSEVRLINTAEPEAEPRVVAPRRQGVEYSVEPAGDRLLIVHNDGAVNFALAQAPLDATDPAQWQPVDLGGSQQGTRILGVDAYERFAVVSLRRGGLSSLHLIHRDASGNLGTGSDLEFDEPLYDVATSGSPEYDTQTVRVHYSSFRTPDTTYDCDLATGQLTLRKRRLVLDDPTWGPFDPDRYVQERSWATAADGTRIPLSIVRRTDIALDGSAPALLYGYGSYEVSIDPSFAVSLLSLLDRGIVYAIAHIRGGGELGRRWYDGGKLLSKRTTFTDFVACADHLVDAGYTSPDRLAADGRSAGGLLMGAVANLAPDTFAAIHAGVPFVDALTTILDPSLPLTVGEWEEWGDPLHDADVYAYMKSYSPYENVAARPYPAILATTSLNDTRVFYVEPAKWVAQLRYTAARNAPILLRTEMVAGHGGKSGRYERWQETAFIYAWIVDQVTGDRA